MGASQSSELEAARRELQEAERRLASPRPFSWSRMTDYAQISRLKRRVARLERDASSSGG